MNDDDGDRPYMVIAYGLVALSGAIATAIAFALWEVVKCVS
jgi:hypothetical protein